MPTKKRKVPDSGFEQESNCSDEKIDRKDVNVFEKLTKFLNDEYPTLESFLEIAESKVSIYLCRRRLLHHIRKLHIITFHFLPGF